MFREMQELIRKIYPSFEDIQKVYEEVRQRFAANHVSGDFPLFYVPKDSQMNYTFSVSLEEHVERDPIIDTMLGYIAEGCKASGMEEIPEEMRWEIERLQKDRFGKTKMFGSLDGLLEELPEQKVIVTDVYIVDHFPELKRMDFQTHEFRI